jgi:hypothetical protein
MKGNLEVSYSPQITLLCIGLSLTMLPPMNADESDQKTIFTFSGPVEIPGQVLNAGTYVFKLAESQPDRNLVQVFNKDETHLYGTFLAIPDFRLKPRGKPIITFDERAAGSPEAVKAWFYPGDNYGHELVYPKPKAIELARANKQPVPSMPAEMAVNTTKPVKTTKEPEIMAMKQAPLKAQKPTEHDVEELEIIEVFLAPPPVEVAANLPNQLPRTASLLPLIGLVGVLSLGTAGALRAIRAARIRLIR